MEEANIKNYLAREKEVERKWYIIGAESKVPSRLASEVASILRGRKKPIHAPSVDTGDYVIVINADKVRLTGKKWDQKQRVYHTEYPEGRRGVSYKELLEKHPECIVRYTVKRMIPKNNLGRRVLRKLKVYAGSEHLHEAQSPETYEF